MRKVVNHTDQYDMFKSTPRTIKNQSSEVINKNDPLKSKNQYFNGNNLGRNQQEFQKQFAKLKDQTPSGSQTDVSRKNEHLSQQIKILKESSKLTIQFSSVTELQNQIQRISIQLNQKNTEIKHLHKINQKRKVQIIQLQKKLKYCEGKNQAINSQMKQYEQCMLKIGKQCDEKAKYESNVKQLVNLFEGMRNQNQELTGKYQQKSYQLNKLSQKYIKLKNKLNIQNATTKNNQIKSRSSSKGQIKLRRGSSLLSISKRCHQVSQNQKQQQNFKQINIKIESMEKSIMQFLQQNQKLHTQLEEKEQIIHKLHIQIQQTSQKYLKQRQKRKNQKNKIRKQLKKEGQIKTKNSCELQKNEQNSIISVILRRLRYNLINSPISYQDLINVLITSQNTQRLMQYPFNLNLMESSQLLKWVKQILKNQSQIQNKETQPSSQQIRLFYFDKLASKIPKFENFINRKLNLLKIPIRNCYNNRQQQLNEQIQQQNILKFNQAYNYFKNWGLDHQQIDAIFIYYFKWTKDIEQINMNVIKQIIQKWKMF